MHHDAFTKGLDAMGLGIGVLRGQRVGHRHGFIILAAGPAGAKAVYALGSFLVSLPMLGPHRFYAQSSPVGFQGLALGSQVRRRADFFTNTRSQDRSSAQAVSGPYTWKTHTKAAKIPTNSIN